MGGDTQYARAQPNRLHFSRNCRSTQECKMAMGRGVCVCVFVCSCGVQTADLHLYLADTHSTRLSQVTSLFTTASLHLPHCNCLAAPASLHLPRCTCLAAPTPPAPAARLSRGDPRCGATRRALPARPRRPPRRRLLSRPARLVGGTPQRRLQHSVHGQGGWGCYIHD